MKPALLALAAYALVLAAAIPIVGGSHAAYWMALAAVLAITVVVMQVSHRPLGFYGLTLRGMYASLGSTLVTTTILGLAGIGLLALLVHQHAPGVPRGSFPPTGRAGLVAYVGLSAPLQELVFRGVFQSHARQILGGDRRAARLAIVFSSAAYAASHLPWGYLAPVLMLGPGIVWGIQFERDRTLVGVVVSHVAISYLFVGATPLWMLITAGR